MDNNFEEVTRKILTLCMLKNGDQVLLGLKKRGFGAGYWNGFGGKVQEGETIMEGAEREVLEECGLKAKNLKKFGELDFEFQNNRGHILEIHYFRCDDFEGEPAESEEMAPKWFHVSQIPLNEMWPDDEHWLPLYLNGKMFTGKFLLGENNSILEKKLIEIDSFDSGGSLDDL